MFWVEVIASFIVFATSCAGCALYEEHKYKSRGFKL